MFSSTLSVRRLAEFTCPGADLYPARRGRAVEPDEGIAIQKQLQQARTLETPSYAREVTVQCQLSLFDSLTQVPGWPQDVAGQVSIQGRIDGLVVDADVVLIEEFKCCGELPDAVQATDRMQALLYAGLHATASESDGPVDYRIAVVYVQADTLEERVFCEKLARSQVQATLAFVVLCYQVRVERHLQRNLRRMQQNEGLGFPYAKFRTSQQAIARRVYQALQQRQRLLLEATTGSGKTMAVLYPAVRFQGLMDQLFYLTSRNVGARAALAAVRDLQSTPNHLTVVEITAKEKICPVPGTPCDAQQCSYARGYYTRRGAAVNALLDDGVADRARITETAEIHHVCPFELSLDAALWADLFIADYNYVFDPMVRLQRFAGNPHVHLLIDEAHQLSPRARDMLEVTIERGVVRDAVKSPTGFLSKRAESIDRALQKLCRQFPQPEQQVPPEALASLERAVVRLLDEVSESAIELHAAPAAQALWFACLRWRRSANWYSETHFAHSLERVGREITLRRLCLDPAPYLDQVLGEHGGSIRFSGTVSPLPLYQRMHGCLTEGVAERADSPFTVKQARVLNIVDIPTYYRQRQAGLAKLVKMISDLLVAKQGRYLVALPSYAYLQDLHAVLQDVLDTNGVPLLAQQRQQTSEQHENLLHTFANNPSGVMLVVSGGVFGESVDFSDTSLRGVVLVGLGLPPPSLERQLIQQYFEREAGAGWGKMVAFMQPALVKDVQAAGRMLRSPQDRGVICLVDARFARAEVQQFFPRHWHVEKIQAAQISTQLDSFWHDNELQVNS
ncbi:MAG: ATP-dependent DNA helicase [Pseudomonadota bacterium]